VSQWCVLFSNARNKSDAWLVQLSYLSASSKNHVIRKCEATKRSIHETIGRWKYDTANTLADFSKRSLTFLVSAARDNNRGGIATKLELTGHRHVAAHSECELLCV